jgi:NAD+ synthase
MKQLATEIVDWMNDYAYKANRKAWVVGVSGGVDSALVSTLCAMTGLPTYCVVMPCQTKSDQTNRGQDHIAWLQERFGEDLVKSVRINLTETFEAFRNETMIDYYNELGYANTKSRLRMTALYQVATCVGGLVVGTGNKVEDGGVRFFTKYGDGGVDISPIADLMKSEVRQMCRELNVLPELCEAVPTDGLWDDTRTDEGQLGATYEELEWAMTFIKNTHGFLSIEEWVDISLRQLEVLAIYNKWHNAGEHKMHMPPTFVRKS